MGVTNVYFMFMNAVLALHKSTGDRTMTLSLVAVMFKFTPSILTVVLLPTSTCSTNPEVVSDDLGVEKLVVAITEGLVGWAGFRIPVNLIQAKDVSAVTAENKIM
jgi:hypothetical protein